MKKEEGDFHEVDFRIDAATNPPLPIQVGDTVRAMRGPAYLAIGTVLALNDAWVCISEASGAWDTYHRKDITQVIKRADAPQPPRHWRIRAEVFYLVKADSAEAALELVHEYPDQHIDFVLAETEDVTPFVL